MNLFPWVPDSRHVEVVAERDYLQKHVIRLREQLRILDAKCDALEAERDDDRDIAQGLVDLLGSSVGGRGTRRQGWDAAMAAVSEFIMAATEEHHDRHGA